MPIDGQDPKLTKLADDLAKEEFGLTPSEAIKQGVCIQCKKEALPKCYSEAGRREYQISAMCEECFDDLFEEEE